MRGKEGGMKGRQGDTHFQAGRARRYEVSKEAEALQEGSLGSPPEKFWT